MAIPVEFTNVSDEMLVADILASWSIEDAQRRLMVPFDRAGLMPGVDRADARTARAADPAERRSASHRMRDVNGSKCVLMWNRIEFAALSDITVPTPAFIGDRERCALA
jgi:hypothetical protein